MVLEPGVILQGKTRIGADTVVGSGSRIVDSVVGERCRIWSSVIESSEVGDDVRVGPWAHLRPGARVGDGAEVGNFAEMKSSSFGRGSKQHHFSYLGDATVGDHVNIGAGTITCNFDGTAKHRTEIGDGAFIGSDTMLVAPVRVGSARAPGRGRWSPTMCPTACSPSVSRPVSDIGDPTRPVRCVPGWRSNRRRLPPVRARSGGIDAPCMNAIEELVVIAILIALNAVFVAAEIALVTIRRSRVEQLVEEGSHAARRVERLLQRPGRFLAVTQLWITFIGFLSSAFAAVTLTLATDDALKKVSPLAPYAAALSLVLVTCSCRWSQSCSASWCRRRSRWPTRSAWPSPCPDRSSSSRRSLARWCGCWSW